MQLVKRGRRSSRLTGEPLYLSAQWEVKEVPGVLISRLGSPIRGKAWRVYLSRTPALPPAAAAHRVVKALEYREFLTLREALEAVELQVSDTPGDRAILMVCS